MSIFRNFGFWWLALLAGSVIVSAVTSQHITLTGLLMSTFAHLLFAVFVSGLPWIVYRLLNKPLTQEQLMSTITVGWLVLAVGNLLVMP